MTPILGTLIVVALVAAGAWLGLGGGLTAVTLTLFVTGLALTVTS